MRKFVIFTLLFLVMRQGFSQIVPSSCEPPALLQTTYEPDISNLALRRIFELESPDTASIVIPQTWRDTILEGMAAILNAVSIPQRDSIFNLYCVHDLAAHPVFIYDQLIIFVDTSYSWTQAWQNLQTQTGNPLIDALMTQYQYQIVQFTNLSFGSMAVIQTNSFWNILALIHQFEQIPGVQFAEPNSIVGAAGRIQYNKTGTERYYNFEFQWNDCFDGCDNSRTWKYRVFEDCSVQFLGIEDWGFFGIEPLPDPLNCNLFSGTDPGRTSDHLIQIFPNPADDQITFETGSLTIEGLQVISGQGVLILEKNEPNIRNVNISFLPCGLYIIKLYTSDHHASIHKLLIYR